MELGNYSVITPDTGKKIDVTQPLQSILVIIDFNAPSALKMASITPAQFADLPKYLMPALGNAVNGKLSMSLKSSKRGIDHTIINNRTIADISEILGSIGGELDFTWIEDTSDYSKWRAAFKINVSHTGTLPLGNDMRLLIEHEAFTNVEVETGHNCDTNVTYIAIVTPTTAIDVIQLSTQTCLQGATTDVELNGQTVFGIPVDMEKITLYPYTMNGASGNPQELKTANINQFASAQARDTIKICGRTFPHFRWFTTNSNHLRSARIITSNIGYTYTVASLPLNV